MDECFIYYNNFYYVHCKITTIVEILSHYFLIKSPHEHKSCKAASLYNADSDDVDLLIKSVNISEVYMHYNYYPSRNDIVNYVIHKILKSYKVCSVLATAMTLDQIRDSITSGVEFDGILTTLDQFGYHLIKRSSYICAKCPTGLIALHYYNIETKFCDRTLQIVYLEDKQIYTEPILNTMVQPTLREYQIEHAESILARIKASLATSRPITLNIGFQCGYGKTWLSYYIVRHLKLRTLISCPTLIIARQWYEILTENLTVNTDICVILSDKGISRLLPRMIGSDASNNTTPPNKSFSCTPEPSILIVIDKHFISPEFSAIAAKFSLFIFDESHSYNFTSNSATCNNLHHIPFPVSLYLSGTPRADNISATGPNFTYSHEHIHKGVIKILDNTKPLTIQDIAACKRKVKYYDNKLYEYTIYVGLIDRLESRNNFIIEQLLNIYCTGVRLIVLCELVVQCEYISTHLSRHLVSSEIYTLKSGQTNAMINDIKIMESLKSFVLVSTIDLCAKGLDVKNLNTLFIANTGIENLSIRQSSGRIMRDLATADTPGGVNKTIYLVRQSAGSSMLTEFSRNRLEIGLSYLEEDGWILDETSKVF